MNTQTLINKFYQSFASGDVESMITCYHDDVVFHDPAFGTLHGERAKSMWRMLLNRADGNIKIQFRNVEANDISGRADWLAEYHYGPHKRKVINNVSAKFEFKDGKIIKHTDHFDLWKWTKQALGTTGYLLGWSTFMKNKIQKMTNDSLAKFISKSGRFSK
ncbi:hypothetical protein EZS27_006131 [termite gut metagenome]|uniref:SnoaL-like domain-containing protein n=1 Tax=termite gut metagenome TaxID=433724 RepID=A0A5J4SJF8_9ZZZZ